MRDMCSSLAAHGSKKDTDVAFLQAALSNGDARARRAAVDALSTVGFDLRLLDYSEHTLSPGDDARAASYIGFLVTSRSILEMQTATGMSKASVSARLPKNLCFASTIAAPMPTTRIRRDWHIPVPPTPPAAVRDRLDAARSG